MIYDFLDFKILIVVILASIIAAKFIRKNIKIAEKAHRNINKLKNVWDDQMKCKYENLCKKTVDIRDFSKFKPSDIENITVLNTLINQYISRLCDNITTTISNLCEGLNENKSTSNQEELCFSKDTQSVKYSNYCDSSHSDPYISSSAQLNFNCCAKSSSTPIILENVSTYQALIKRNSKTQKSVSFKEQLTTVHTLLK